MRTVKVSFPADVFEQLDREAAYRCKTRSEYARDAIVAYMTKYPAKGPVADLVRSRRVDPKNLGFGGNPRALPETNNSLEVN